MKMQDDIAQREVALKNDQRVIEQNSKLAKELERNDKQRTKAEKQRRRKAGGSPPPVRNGAPRARGGGEQGTWKGPAARRMDVR